MHLGFGLNRLFLNSMHFISILYRKIILRKKIKSIYFFPDKPTIFDVIYKISIWNGYLVAKSQEDADINFHWEDCTFPKALTDRSFINSQCKSVSKIAVESSFEKVFGYKLLLDPNNFEGKCVRKNNLNAKHDGKIIDCPIVKLEKGYVYQHLINNAIDSRIIEDIRVPFIKNQIPFVYIKYRLISKRFSNENLYTKIDKVSNVLSAKETTNIIKVCNNMKLDYCELDIIRDYPEGKLYVVDINHCPSGPPNHLSFFFTLYAIKQISKTFDEKFGS